MNEVKDYIDRHPGINDIVLYAGILTSEEFSKNSEITIELYKDTESYNSYLVISVRLENYDSDIDKRLDKVRDEYEDSLIGQSGWLLLKSDFKPPGR